jgi:hypothetical protein
MGLPSTGHTGPFGFKSSLRVFPFLSLSFFIMLLGMQATTQNFSSVSALMLALWLLAQQLTTIQPDRNSQYS